MLLMLLGYKFHIYCSGNDTIKNTTYKAKNSMNKKHINQFMVKGWKGNVSLCLSITL